jgi:hypothetical protein
MKLWPSPSRWPPGIEVAEVVTSFEDEAEDAAASVLPPDSENEIDLTGTRSVADVKSIAGAVTESAAAAASFTKGRRWIQNVCI